MKRFCIIVLFFIVLTIVIPMAIFYIVRLEKGSVEKSEIQYDKKSETIKVYMADTGNTEDMEIEEYLVGVVSAEMPASFEAEALKAQAVAARSYAVYKKENPGNEHPGAAVCTDYNHCKAYKKDEELRSQWGNDYELYSEKIRSAVNATKNEVLTYAGEVALTVFHSQSGGGRTESSKDVWGGDVPYLVSVESYEKDTVPGFYSSVSVTFEEFKNVLKKHFPQIEISSAEDIGDLEKSEGGSVKKIDIAGYEISGKEIRSMFNLRSSCFEIKTEGGNITFEVAGYGHGVGMSQYGANAMAQDGYSYREILTHYYSGTVVEAV